MKLIAGLGAVAQGAGLGLADMRQEEERQRRIKNEEADRAYMDEQRTQQRTQWERSNEDADRQKRIREGVAKASGEYTPEEIELGLGDGGEPNTKAYRIDGRLFDSLDNPEAKSLLGELNSPLGQAKRMAMVHMKEGDYPGAQKVLADATRMTVDNFALDKLKRTAEAEKANDAVMGVIFGEPGSNKFENAARLATQTKLFGLDGKEIRPEVTADGKRVVMGIYSTDGLDNKPVRHGTLGTYSNDRAGVMALLADFSKGTPEQKMALYKEIAAAERQAAEDVRKGEKHTADLGMVAAHTRAYDASANASNARAAGGGGSSAGVDLRRDQFDAREWNSAAKIDKTTVSIVDELSGKSTENADLRLLRQQVFNQARAQGTMAPNEAAEMADTQVVRLKNIASERVAAARAADKKSTLTVEQEIRNILKAYQQQQGKQQAPAANGAPAAAPITPARATAAPGLDSGRADDPLASMNVKTLRRIASIPGHVNQKAAAARLAELEASASADVERQMQENPRGFGLAMP